LEKIKDIIQENENFAQGYSNIKTIVGIGEVAGIVLMHLFIKSLPLS